MSIDERVTDVAPVDPAPRSRQRLVAAVAATVAGLAMAAIGGWAVGGTSASTSASTSARAHHDALLESVDLMPPMWEQLQLPVDQRSQVVIESGARIGGPGSAIEVTPELRVNEPNRIGVATTVRSDGITTVLVTIVRNDLSGSSDALGSGCEIGTSVDGLTCEDWVNKQFTTWTAPGG